MSRVAYYVCGIDGTVESSSALDVLSPTDCSSIAEARSLGLHHVDLDEGAAQLVAMGPSRTLVIVSYNRFGLTPRQREVAEYAAAGATAPEIARALDLSVYTVRQHLKAVYRRLQVGNRVELHRALGAPL